jgi:TonB-dependent starch-binding outer membrane protein SusC
MTKFYLFLSRYLTVLLMLTASVAMAQTRTVTGKVTSASDGAAIPGASILEKGTNRGAMTDADGNFTISVAENATLVFSFVGLVTQEIAVGNQTNINVQMQDDVSSLDEVVIVGYGTQAKREISGSIVSVKGDKLMTVPTTSFEAALQGQAAGVQVVQGSGLAGSGSVIRIRGIASVGANADPLYVVDGIPITTDNFLQEANWQNGAMNNNPLSAINPADIESIEILKDASAAGIYGSRGSNGVILITTKRGANKSGKPVFDFSANLGSSSPVAKPKFYNSQEWLQIRQEAWENDGNTGAVWIPGYSASTNTPAERAAAYQEASQHDTDWWDAVTQTGFKQQYNLSGRWTKNKLNAFVGGSYSDNESYIVGNQLQRYSVRANLDYRVSEKFDVSINSSYSKGVNKRVRAAYTGGLGLAMSTSLPVYPIYNDDGTFFRTTAGGGNGNNPVFETRNFQGYTVDDRAISGLVLRYKLLSNLKLTATGSYDYLYQTNDIWQSAALMGLGYNEAERDTRKVDNFNITGLADYDYPLQEGHKLKILLGGEYQHSLTSGKNNIVYQGLNVNSTQYKGEGTFTDETRVPSRLYITPDLKWSFVSTFLRANYSIQDKYFLQATARADGSAKFGANKRYGFFPVLSGAWLLTQENFMKAIPAISFLKLKAGYGVTGNANIADYQHIATYIVNNQPVYNGLPIRYREKVDNPNLKWETTKNFDIGLESGFFNDRIEAEIGYYIKNTEDVLMNITIPGYNGFGSFYGNVGEVRNRGIEVTLNTVNFESERFRWTTNFNIAFNTNEVLSLGGYTPDAVAGGTNDTRIVEGYPLGTNYLVRFSHVDPATGKPVYLDKDGYETFEYNVERDRMPVGDVLPDAVGSFTNTFAYQNFDLSFMFVFVIGGDIYDSSSKRQMGFLTDWVTREDMGDRWRQPGDVAKYPRVTMMPSTYGGNNEWFNTDMWVHDASYLRLRTISLGYNLPTDLLAKAKISKARIAISGMNLLTFTKFPGLDPEVVRDFDNQTDRNMSPSISYLTPPQERSFNLSLNITF